MKRNKAPCTVPSMRSWGVRKNWRMVRFALCREAVTKLAPVVGAIVDCPVGVVVCGLVVVIETPGSGGVGLGRLRVGVGVGRVEVFARDREEHLVEAGTAETDVVDLDASFVEQTNDVAQLVPASFDASRDALGVHVGVRRFATDPSERLLHCRKVARGSWPNLDHIATGAVLQLVGSSSR